MSKFPCANASRHLPTITIRCCSINHHKPTTLCFHGNIFEYAVAWSFTYTLVSSQFLRNVPIERYLHLSTATHKFVVIYSLSWMHCIYTLHICNEQCVFSYQHSTKYNLIMLLYMYKHQSASLVHKNCIGTLQSLPCIRIVV